MRTVHRDIVYRVASVATLAFASMTISPIKAFAQPAPAVVAPTPTESAPVVSGVSVQLRNGSNIDSYSVTRASPPTVTVTGPCTLDLTFYRNLPREQSDNAVLYSPILRYTVSDDQVTLASTNQSTLTPASPPLNVVDNVSYTFDRANAVVGSARPFVLQVPSGEQRYTFTGPGGFLVVGRCVPPLAPQGTVQNGISSNNNQNPAQVTPSVVVPAPRIPTPSVPLPHYSLSLFGSILPLGVNGAPAAFASARGSYYLRLGSRTELSISGSALYRRFGFITSQLDASANVFGGGGGFGVLRSFGVDHHLEIGLFVRGGIAPLSASVPSSPAQTDSADPLFIAYGLSLRYFHPRFSIDASATSGLLVAGSDLANPLHVDARYHGIRVPWLRTARFSLGASVDLLNFPEVIRTPTLEATQSHLVAMVRAGVPISQTIVLEAGAGFDLFDPSPVFGLGVLVLTNR